MSLGPRVASAFRSQCKVGEPGDARGAPAQQVHIVVVPRHTLAFLPQLASSLEPAPKPVEDDDLVPQRTGCGDDPTVLRAHAGDRAGVDGCRLVVPREIVRRARGARGVVSRTSLATDCIQMGKVGRPSCKSARIASPWASITLVRAKVCSAGLRKVISSPESN